MSRPNDFAQRWFRARGWKAFAFQKEVWAAVKQGESGLLHASTGSGKTYAVWFAALNRFATTKTPPEDKPRKKKPPAAPLSVMWITPMRALAADTARALEAPLAELDVNWSVGLRTGDTAAASEPGKDVVCHRH